MKHRYRIALDTMTHITNFVNMASGSKEKIELTNSSGNFRVSAKSLLGVLYSMEWDVIYCESDAYIYPIVKDFLIEDHPEQDS